MDQIHKRFSNEQVKLILQGYIQGRIARTEAEKILQINKTRFFAILKQYRKDPGSFSVNYRRDTHARLSTEVEAAIAEELLREKELVETPNCRSAVITTQRSETDYRRTAIACQLIQLSNEQKSWVVTKLIQGRKCMIGKWLQLRLEPWYNMMLPHIYGRLSPPRNGP